MSFNFVIPELQINGAGTPPLQFFRQGFYLGGDGSAPSWQDIVLSGNGSLILTNAKANGLNYVKLFGACEQDGTPYPDRPVDISCNNGTLKFRYSNGLPLGYVPLEHVSYLGTTLSLGIAGFDDDTSEIYVEWKTDSTSVASDYQGVFTVWSANTYNSWRMLTYLKQTDKYYCYGNSRNPVTVSNVELDTWHTIECKSGKFKIDNNTYNTTVTSSLTPSDITLKIGGSSYLNNYYKYVKVKRQGEWIGIFLPAKRLSDNKIGLYDIVNDSFKTSTNFTAGREIDVPIEIYTDGTVETVQDSLENTATAENLLGVDRITDVQEVLTGEITRNISYKIFDGTESFGSSSAYGTALYIQSAAGTWKADKSKTPICTHFLGIAQATGVQSANTCFFNASGHFYFRTSETAADFKTWLTDLYNAGTPMVLVYVSSAPTTETVTGQHLTTQAGTNVITITQASINNLPLEVSYKAQAS